MTEPRSRFFALHEFNQREIPYPAEWVQTIWIPMAFGLWDRVREIYGAPITVLSGYRSVEFNAALKAGGHNVATDSRHSHGDGADLVPSHAGFKPGEELRDACRRLHDAVLAVHPGGTLPLLGGLGIYAGWVHVDGRPHKPGVLARWNG